MNEEFNTLAFQKIGGKMRNVSRFDAVEEVIRVCVRNKIHGRKPVTKMPFHKNLVGAEILAHYNFLQSLNTSLGNSVFEEIAYLLAKDRFQSREKQFNPGNKISKIADQQINDIINSLGNKKSDKSTEVEMIRRVAKSGDIITTGVPLVDLKLERNGRIYLIDIKTAKPNRAQFLDFKRTLLKWVGITLLNDINADVNSLIAIPYNPFEPNPYNWMNFDTLDIAKELKVAEDFWDFIGGEGTYIQLLSCFDRMGIELKDEIFEYRKNFESNLLS